LPQDNEQQFLTHVDDLYYLIGMLGVELRAGSDFQEFHDILDGVPDRHEINPAFNPKFSNLDEENAVWLIGHNKDGDVVHTQAMKLLNLENQTLSDHFSKNIANFVSEGYDFSLGKTEVYLSSEASKISGKVSYHGEVWMKPGRGGYRGGSLIVLLTRLMIIKTLLKWSPDYLIGLQAPLTSCRGLGVREGYMRAEQRTLVWHMANGEPPQEDWMVWMNGEEAEFNLRLPPQYIYETFKKSTDPDFETLMATSLKGLQPATPKVKKSLQR